MALFVEPALGDEAVMSTNDDATCSKKAAVQLGYWTDPYINQFCLKTVKKAPEINRGYFIRVHAVQQIVQQYVKSSSLGCQVVSIGAGFDSLFWNLADANFIADKYVELDFPNITRQKTQLILRSNLLKAKLGPDIEILPSDLGIVTASYALLPVDLRKTEELSRQLQRANLIVDKPTLLLAECVLMYIKHDSCEKLLSTLGSYFKTAHFLSYDVINMVDRFAEVMLSNLESRNCPLQVSDCVNKDSHVERFRRCGWSQTGVYTMLEIYQHLPQKIRGKIERLEMLDEVHLLNDLLHHYCICLSSNSSNLLELSNLRELLIISHDQ